MDVVHHHTRRLSGVDGSQPGLHANFKLSASGESLYLLDPDQRIGQEVTFGNQTTDMGYARIPNGTGDFVIKQHTFFANNETGVNATSDVAEQKQLEIYPNPASGQVTVRSKNSQLGRLQVFNVLGQMVLEMDWQGVANFDVNSWQPGVYWVKAGEVTRRLMVE